jgi:cyclophilin family peptidyl-prolyl cis-trans isomerase/uncharacterized SAM-binding protein YcdF (DUF218 family)
MQSAIVVLGCRPYAGRDGRLVGALGRRLGAAARLYRDGGVDLVVVTGGARAFGRVESDAMAAELVALGVPRAAVVRERCSLFTRENARYTADLLRARGIDEVRLVTCDWHMARAAALFRAEGLGVREAPVASPPIARRAALYRRIRETVIRRLDLLLSAVALVLVLAACSKPKPGAAPADAASAASSASAADLATIARAEDERRARDVPEAARTGRDVALRRRAARALARIEDPASVPALLRALEDDDAEVVAWAAYGLGETCRGERAEVESRVRALAARETSIGDAGAAPPLDAHAAIVRSIGRCGGDLAEAVLTSYARASTGSLEPIAYALGDVAGARHRLGDEAVTALLDAAGGRPEAAPDSLALYPLTRLDKVPEAFRDRVLSAARGALARPGDARIFAVRALARSGDDAAPDLVRVAEDKQAYTPAERAAAALGLGLLGKAGHEAAADALAYLAPDSRDPSGIGALGGAECGVLSSLLEQLGPEPPKRVDPTLYALAALVVPPDASESLRGRIADLRCAAAGALARGAWDAAVIRQCDDPAGEPAERARLAAILAHKTQTVERRAAWSALAHSAHPKVREAALDAIPEQPDLKDAARAALADALASGSAGVVATAADALYEHPERAYGLARSEIRAALDPHAPPPSANPKQEIDPRIVAALAGAIAHPWAQDLFETRIAVFEAGVALGLKEGKDAALAACKDANVTVRAKAEAALRVSDPGAQCKAPDAAPPPAPEVDAPLAHPVSIVFSLDAGELSVALDPALAPVTATRLAALARAGFFRGIVVHRVVPGFVVQLGDPGGDGFGGSGTPLRCETSPVPFAPLSVGMALAGRDTGSSQIFVTLSRTPHLDGEYAWVGRAQGDWWAVAQGDLVRDASVKE